MKYPFALLALVCTSFATDLPPTKVIIQARFTEAETKTGRPDMVSAPSIITHEGQAATIRMGQQTSLNLSGTTLKDAHLDFSTGISIDVTGWAEGDDVILRGTATRREQTGGIHSAPDGTWAQVRVDELPFVLRLKNGESRDLPLQPPAGSSRQLTIQISARKYIPVNASPLYWQAFAAMPNLAEAEKKLLDANAFTPGAAEQALVAKTEAALKLFGEATRADYCDWNLDLSKGPSLSLPHLGPARELAQLALLKGRLNHGEAACIVHEQVLRLARHVAASPLLVSRLVGLSIETKAIESIAALLPEWDEPFRQRIGTVVANLGPVPTISDDVAAEGQSMSQWLSNELDAQVKKSGATFDVRAWLGQILTPAGTNTDEVFKRIDSAAGALPHDERGVRQLIDSYRAQMQELARVTKLPRAQMKQEATAFEERIKAEPHNPFIALLTPAVLKARESELKGEVRLALLKAALDLQANREPALPASLATQRETEHGYELVSKELFDGKPIVLAVGPR